MSKKQVSKVASTAVNAAPKTSRTLMQRVGAFILEHVRMRPAPGCGKNTFIASNTTVEQRSKCPSLVPKVISVFFENQAKWSTRACAAIRREFAEATLHQYATEPKAMAVLADMLALFHKGERVAISGFAIQEREWTDVRSLVLAALCRLDKSVADHVCSWTGAEMLEYNKHLVQSKFEQAWSIGLFDNNDVTDPELLKQV